jgi:UDP-N-acetylglucosamine--dolichyl-phosphate N-acetylglucosaminephosphotransferase
MNIFIPIFLVSFIVSFLGIAELIPRLQRAGICGKDVNKPGTPDVAEMGGLGISAGFGCGLLLAIALETFFLRNFTLDIIALLAALATVLIIVLIGILDDLLDISHRMKAILPISAALPLIAVKVGETTMQIPFMGEVDFGIYYSVILVPLGITVAANTANMLAGFNGMEVGMGLVAVGSLALIAYTLEATTSIVLLLAMLGALLATLYYNRYPARILIGDVGTLSIGALIATSVILGNFEMAGAVVMIPYFIDFFIKAINRFPSKGWWGFYKDGKLYCLNPVPVSLCQWIMKLAGGISEQKLVLTLVGIEAVFGLAAVLLYVKL